MKWSLDLGNISGIKLRIHWTFVLLIGYIIYINYARGGDANTALWSVLFVLTVFVCVVLHELGHALTGRRFGIPTTKITLLPIGGVASMQRMPENPRQELLVAIAGPLVNVGIALLLFVLFANTITETAAKIQEYAVQLQEGTTDLSNEAQQYINISPHNFIFYLFFVNIFLVIFNAIPAFPMDGGRVLRALLAMKMGRTRATQIASNLGQFVAILFVIWGFYSNPFLIFIGLFVFLGAYSENVMVQQLESLRGHRVREAMITNFLTLKPTDSIQDALDKLLAGSDHDFVVETDKEVVGILSRSDLIGALQSYDRSAPIKDIMDAGFEALDIDDKLTRIYSSLATNRNKFYPVLEDGKLAGVINQDNINEFIMIQSALR